MLYDVPSMRRIRQVPFGETYWPLRKALDQTDPQAFDKIHEELTNRFVGSEIETSSWIPGAIWQDTPWYPIYLAAGEDQQLAAKFFGLIVWNVVIDLPDAWGSGKYEKDGMPIKGRTYFRIRD